MAGNRAKIFKFQNLKILRYSDEEILANIRVGGSVNFSLSPELAEQMAGPSFFTVETEVSTVGTEATLNIGEYSSDVLEALMGAATTEKTITSGLLENPRNVKGTGLFASGGGGIVSAALNSDTTKIRSGYYRIKSKDGAAEIEVYALSSPELPASAYENFRTGLVKTLTMADAEALDTTVGVTLTCASTFAADNISEDDAFVFRVYAPGADAYQADIGQAGMVIPKVKIITTSRTMSDDRWLEVLWHNCIFPGLNFNFADEFSANEITGKIIFDDQTQKLGEVFYRSKNA